SFPPRQNEERGPAAGGPSLPRTRLWRRNLAARFPHLRGDPLSEGAKCEEGSCHSLAPHEVYHLLPHGTSLVRLTESLLEFADARGERLVLRLPGGHPREVSLAGSERQVRPEFV